MSNFYNAVKNGFEQAVGYIKGWLPVRRTGARIL